MDVEKKDFYCGKCSKKFSKKQNWEEHFEKQTVLGLAGSKGYHPNICYNTKDPKVWANDLENAVKKYREEVKQKEKLFGFFKRKVPTSSTTGTGSIEDEIPPTPENESNKNDPQPPPKKKKLEPGIDSEELKNTLNLILKFTEETHQAVTGKDSDVNKNKNSNKKDSTVSTDTSFQSSLALLSKAKSVKDIMENDLIRSSFKLVENNNEPPDDEAVILPEEVMEHIDADDMNLSDKEGEEDVGSRSERPHQRQESLVPHKLYCIACSNIKSSNMEVNCHLQGFGVKKIDYVCQKGDNQERWIVNLKASLKRHLLSLQHHKKVAVYEVMRTSRLESVKKIEETCSNILYYIIKTNTAWSLFPVLLGVLNRSGHEIGNINHGRDTCEMMSNLLDQELRKETREWFLQQKSVTLTADIGTVLGLSMLVVLLESEVDNTVRLAGISLVKSKAGKYLAEETMNILKSDSEENLNLMEEDIKSRVSGMAGDGAFCKDNDPFKSAMRELFGLNFKFRWDLLHLMNRAHIQALKNCSRIQGLLDFVQHHSSSLRSGLAYTEMIIENVVGFKRPKLKSETRMVNFEFEQLSRFLENAKFFDHPKEMLSLSKHYVLLTYVTKIILKVSQKTNVSSQTVQKLFYEEQGKKVMKKVIGISSSLIGGQTVKDVLSSFESTEGEDKFIVDEVLKFISKFSEEYDYKEDDRTARTRRESNFREDDVLTVLDNYVEDLWEGIKERLTHFDSDGSTGWSEAPAEGIFSILNYIIEHKPSLSVKHMIQLSRVVKEGPSPGTRRAENLTRRALSHWPSSYGARFTTNSYIHGVTSSTVAKVMNKD